MKKNKCTIGIIGLGRFGTLVASVLSKHAKIKESYEKQ
jgi:phosphoglycerate dehydrogenase-like enzyme